MPKMLPAVLLSVALGLSSAALAQTSTQQPEKTPPSAAPPEKMSPGAKPESGTSATGSKWHTPQSGEMRASDLMGTSVKNKAGERIGEINEVVIAKDGNVAAVVVGVGGFLGLGEREVGMRFDTLQLGGDSQDPTVTVNTNKEALKDAPEWKWSDDGGGATGSQQ